MSTQNSRKKQDACRSNAKYPMRSKRRERIERGLAWDPRRPQGAAGGGEGTRDPRPQPRLTPSVGPEGNAPIALHQVRPLEAVFVLETAMRQLALGARGAGGRGVASHAVALDEATEPQQQGAEKRPESGLATPSPGSRHLGF